MSELGQAQAFTVKLANMIQAQEPEAAALPGAIETMLNRKFEDLQATMTAALAAGLAATQTTLEDRLTAVQTNLEDRLTAVQTNLEGRLTRIENNIAKTRQELKTFKTTFGQWSRPVAQRFNKECFLGTGFQPVPYSNGEFPDEATMRQLKSRSSIFNLDDRTLARICSRYGIQYPWRVAHRNPANMKQDLLDHLCGDLVNDGVNEGEDEDHEEQDDEREQEDGEEPDARE
ncbi:hypothetical protein FS837_008892 [Tulasnella sp. UAMH 9824]|nr:hypothetical protein FS837_008892 [Tulasnella sp. UAMH 9824]